MKERFAATGAAIRQAMEAKGLSDEDVATMLKWSVPDVEEYSQGRKPPTLNNAVGFAQAVGVNPALFCRWILWAQSIHAYRCMFGTNPPPPLSPTSGAVAHRRQH
jgi:transcriptional regulator with XRE-family HTH domain